MRTLKRIGIGLCVVVTLAVAAFIITLYSHGKQVTMTVTHP